MDTKQMRAFCDACMKVTEHQPVELNGKRYAQCKCGAHLIRITKAEASASERRKQSSFTWNENAESPRRTS